MLLSTRQPRKVKEKGDSEGCFAALNLLLENENSLDCRIQVFLHMALWNITSSKDFPAFIVASGASETSSSVRS